MRQLDVTMADPQFVEQVPRDEQLLNPCSSRLLSLQQLMELRRPEYLVDGVMPSRGLVILFGSSGVGKSFLMVDLACCVSTGRNWQERKAIAGSVIYVAAEGAHGYRSRISAWAGGRVSADSQLHSNFYVWKGPVDLFEPGEVGSFLEEVEGIEGLRLVVVDTLARCMTGEENSATDMGAVVRGADRIREATGATVVLVHHTGKDEQQGGRGSSALPGAADTVIQIKRSGNGIKLVCEKQKEDEPFKDIHLAFEPVELLGEGWNEGQSGRRIVSTEGCSKQNVSMDVLTEDSAYVLSVLKDTFGRVGARSTELQSACKDLKRSKFQIALKSLRENGYVRFEQSGRCHRYWAVEGKCDLGFGHVQTRPDMSTWTYAAIDSDVSNVSNPLKGVDAWTHREGEPSSGTNLLPEEVDR